jgi:Domain of unknown function (DUF4440)
MIDVVALLRRYHSAQNAFDMARVESMFAENAVYVSPALSGELKSRSVIMMAMRKHFAEYSNQVSRDQEIKQIDDYTVWSRWSLNATSAFSGAKIIRKGTETIKFNSLGHIQSIEVKDD